MEIWLDTVDLDVVADGAKTGIVSGVTTNPSILSNTSNVAETISRLLEIQTGPVAVQVTSSDLKGMIEEALSLFEFSTRLIVKIPVNRNGLIAIQHLRREGIPVLGTGVIYPTQALLASNQGASYIAPYFSHMVDVGDPGATLKAIVDILQIHRSSTKILAASLKQLDHITFCALAGVAAVTIKPDLYHKLMADQPAVEGFSKRFMVDWMQTHGDVSIKEALMQKGSS